MNPKHKRNAQNTILVLFLLLLAWYFDYLCDGLGTTLWGFRIANLSVYFGLLSFWGVSIQRRITNSKLRHYLINILIFMYIWFLIRAVDLYAFPEDYYGYVNYCQYGYYICKMGILMTFLFLSLYIGKDENYKAPALSRLSLIPAIILIILAMTNRSHGFVYGIVEGTSRIYYKTGYFFIFLWIILVTIAALFHIWFAYSDSKNRRKIKWPSLIILLLIIYQYLYYSNSFIASQVDYTIAYITAIIAVAESFIQTGLIPSNSDFEWCLKHSVLKAQLIDYDLNVCKHSEGAFLVNTSLFNRMRGQLPILASEDREMFIADIPGGYVAWERDITEENDILEELDSIGEELRLASDTLRENIRVERKRHELAERNRLYDLIISKTDFKIEELKLLLTRLSSAQGDEFRELLCYVNMIGVYIKRKSNLILVEEMKTGDIGRELKLCFKETFDNLCHGGIKADFLFREIPSIGIDVALIIYDLLETFIERKLNDISEIISIVTDNRQATSMTLNGRLILGVADENALRATFEKWQELLADNYGGEMLFETDEKDFCIMVTIPKGGER